MFNRDRRDFTQIGLIGATRLSQNKKKYFFYIGWRLVICDTILYNICKNNEEK